MKNRQAQAAGHGGLEAEWLIAAGNNLYVQFMASEKELISTSKFLSYVLRHHPESVGVHLDRRGWVSVNELVEKSQKRGRRITPEKIKKVIASGSKQRFVLSPDEQFIRAGYGHSIDVDLGLEPECPPSILYHGTARRNMESIRQQGLRAGSRNYVHLSADRSDAKSVGARHGKPVILKIRAEKLYQEGIPLYRSDSEPGIWMVESVPPKYIED